MKKILIALTVLGLGMSALQQARGDDVSIDVFYNNLSGGNWIEVEGYGYGWQPDVAVNDSNWRPYADGYWAYTDDGWTWISYEDFGWATYHYGRWANLTDYGWTWFPGSDLDWGPAWVSWRTGGDYVGWAPLPPRGVGVVYEGRPIGPQVDIEFDIGPEYYNFCEVRFIGEPVLRNYIAPPVQNVTYINNTVNVTNITVQNNVVYNYGPDYNVLSAQSARPIQRLSIERQSATNLSAAAKSGALTKVQGNKLVVAAPRKLAKAPPTAKPPAVKTKVAQPKLNRGWAGVPDEAQLKQKIRTENPKNVPPPTGVAARAPGSPPAAAGASPTAPAGAAAPAVSSSPAGRPGRLPPGAIPTPPGAGVTPPGAKPTPPGARATPPAARATPPAARATPPAARATPPAARATPPPGRATPPETKATPPGAPGRPAPGFRASPPPKEPAGPPRGRPGVSPGAREPGGSPSVPEQRRGRGPETKPEAGTPLPPAAGAREDRGGVERGQPGYGQPGTPPTGAGPGEARGGKERGQPGAQRPPTIPPAGAAPGEMRGGRERGQGAYSQPDAQPKGRAPASTEQGQGKPERGKKKGEATPSPRP